MTDKDRCQYFAVLGSGAAVPEPGRGAPSNLLRYGVDIMLIDAGRGFIDRLYRLGHNPDSINYICLTHLHPHADINELERIFRSQYHNPFQIASDFLQMEV